MTSDASDLNKALSRLHLEPGDILLVHDPDLLEPLASLRSQLTFPVAVLYSGKGGIETVSREQLLLALEISEKPA